MDFFLMPLSDQFCKTSLAGPLVLPDYRLLPLVRSQATTGRANQLQPMRMLITLVQHLLLFTDSKVSAVFANSYKKRKGGESATKK